MATQFHIPRGPTQYDISWLKNRLDHGDPLKFIYFWGHTPAAGATVGKFCFSQWFHSPFMVDQIVYPTAEHWMMAQKALLFHDHMLFEKIIASEKPGEARDLGRRVSNYDDDIWKSNRCEIVIQGNLHKFGQHTELADYLLKTNDRILVEASPMDTIWGIGIPHDSPDIAHIRAWPGQNLLGFVLMEVRDLLNQDTMNPTP